MLVVHTVVHTLLTMLPLTRVATMMLDAYCILNPNFLKQLTWRNPFANRKKLYMHICGKSTNISDFGDAGVLFPH